MRKNAYDSQTPCDQDYFDARWLGDTKGRIGLEGTWFNRNVVGVLRSTMHSPPDGKGGFL